MPFFATMHNVHSKMTAPTLLSMQQTRKNIFTNQWNKLTKSVWISNWQWTHTHTHIADFSTADSGTLWKSSCYKDLSSFIHSLLAGWDGRPKGEIFLASAHTYPAGPTMTKDIWLCTGWPKEMHKKWKAVIQAKWQFTISAMFVIPQTENSTSTNYTLAERCKAILATTIAKRTSHLWLIQAGIIPFLFNST